MKHPHRTGSVDRQNLTPTQLQADVDPMALIASAPECLRTPQPQQLLPHATSYRNVIYAAVAGYRPLLLDLHLPADHPAPHPLVVYAHPGGFFVGAKEWGPWPFLLDAGYAVASVAYRLREEAVYPAPLHDIKAAVRWCRSNGSKYSLNTDRIAGWGSSAGAYLITMAALTNGDAELEGAVGQYLDTPSDLDAVIDFYGPTDWTTFDEDAHPDGPIEQPGLPDSTAARFLGYLPCQHPEDTQRASPVHRATQAAPPMLIAHGDKDIRVGQRQSLRLHKALRTAGADATFLNVIGAGHGGPQFDSPDMQARILQFLNRALATTNED